VRPLESIQHQLNAASGWLDLGSIEEAHDELEKIPHAQRTTPEVLKLRCRIYRQAEKWDYLSILGESSYSACPEESQFLLDWAWAEYKQGHREQAVVILLRESGKFPQNEQVAYHLALTLASLERIAEAREWLSLAVECAQEPDKLKLRALEQPEFEKVWVETKAGL
jgi:tetratricopeptide (TPR) repeat protein